MLEAPALDAVYQGWLVDALVCREADSDQSLWRCVCEGCERTRLLTTRQLQATTLARCSCGLKKKAHAPQLGRLSLISLPQHALRGRVLALFECSDAASLEQLLQLTLTRADYVSLQILLFHYHLEPYVKGLSSPWTKLLPLFSKVGSKLLAPHTFEALSLTPAHLAAVQCEFVITPALRTLQLTALALPGDLLALLQKQGIEQLGDLETCTLLQLLHRVPTFTVHDALTLATPIKALLAPVQAKRPQPVKARGARRRKARKVS